MDYVIIVNDNGELKSVTATELDALALKHPYLCEALDRALNIILDMRSTVEVDRDPDYRVAP